MMLEIGRHAPSLKHTGYLLALTLTSVACGDSDEGNSAAADGGQTSTAAGSGAADNTGGADGMGDAAGGGDTGQTSNGGSQSSSTGEDAERVGRFDISVDPPREATALADAVEGSATLNGRIYTAPLPEGTIWTASDEADGCELLEPSFPFCDPGCSGGDVCVEGNECVPQPGTISAGTISVSGLETVSGSGDFSMEPLNATSNNYSAYGDSKLVYPPFAAGDPVRFEASGGDAGPFVLEATGVTPVEMLSDDALPLEEQQPLVLEWTAVPEANARIQVNVDISHHGGTKGEIICDIEDSGYFEVPADLVTKLIELGVAGFPSVYVTRRSSGSANIDLGRVDLIVSSATESLLEIPGLISCNGEGCPDGQVCQQDLTCQ